MPTYEYECEGCGHSFEEFQSMSAAALKNCPKCKEDKLQRLIGAGAGIIFKGSGFYETDYKRKEQPKPAADKTPPAASASSDSAAPASASGPSASSGKDAGSASSGASAAGEAKQPAKAS